MTRALYQKFIERTTGQTNDSQTTTRVPLTRPSNLDAVLKVEVTRLEVALVSRRQEGTRILAFADIKIFGNWIIRGFSIEKDTTNVSQVFLPRYRAGTPSIDFPSDVWRVISAAILKHWRAFIDQQIQSGGAR